MSRETAAASVAKGAALLDEKDPGWWRADTDRAIDLDELELEDAQRCVLGQRCPLVLRPGEQDANGGPFWAYALALAGAEPGEEDEWLNRRVNAWAEEHGFEIGPDADYPELTAEWRKVITERRSA